MILLVARKRFTHDGVTYQPGQRFKLPAIHAAAMKYQGNADFVTERIDPPPAKRHYSRRDLTAESD